MGQLRAIIIDEDRTRRESVKAILPDYIDSVALGYGDGALDYLKPDAEGAVPDLVIMYGDDKKSLGLYTYDWMINKSGSTDIASIPVVILTDDEFSDRAMEFLEIGDVVFYEGELDESEFFSVITEAIEEAEFAPEPLITGYEETKNIDRLMGLSVKAPGDGMQRAVVLDKETQMANLMAALERGKQRAKDIQILLDAAAKVKDSKNSDSDIDNGYAEYKKRRAEAFERQRDRKAKREQELKEAEEFDRLEQEYLHNDPVQKLKTKAMNNPMSAMGAQGTIMLDATARRKASDPERTYEKKTVVIVDHDVKARKLCALFLTQNYNVVALDSGIKTVDYFVKNRADLLIINPALPGMNGMMTVNSVRMQPGGSNIPVMYLVGDDYKESRSHLLGPGVVGILNKPIKRELIARAVEGHFGNLQ